MAKIVVREVRIGAGDGGFKLWLRMGVSSIQMKSVIQQSKKRGGGIRTVDQGHTRKGDVAAGVLGNRKLVINGREIATQCAREFGQLRFGGCRLSAQILIPDQVESSR